MLGVYLQRNAFGDPDLPSLHHTVLLKFLHPHVANPVKLWEADVISHRSRILVCCANSTYVYIYIYMVQR